MQRTQGRKRFKRDYSIWPISRLIAKHSFHSFGLRLRFKQHFEISLLFKLTLYSADQANKNMLISRFLFSICTVRRIFLLLTSCTCIQFVFQNWQPFLYIFNFEFSILFQYVNKIHVFYLCRPYLLLTNGWNI